MARIATTLLVLMCAVACSTFARSQSLDLQERCASQARKMFEEWKNEYKADQSALLEPKIVKNDYRSHYNAKLKRCLMPITASVDFSAVGMISNQCFLVDAYERWHYAFYGEAKYYDTERAERSGQSWLPSCELTPSLRQKTLCKPRGEFDAFVAEYMGE